MLLHTGTRTDAVMKLLCPHTSLKCEQPSCVSGLCPEITPRPLASSCVTDVINRWNCVRRVFFLNAGVTHELCHRLELARLARRRFLYLRAASDRHTETSQPDSVSSAKPCQQRRHAEEKTTKKENRGAFTALTATVFNPVLPQLGNTPLLRTLEFKQCSPDPFLNYHTHI